MPKITIDRLSQRRDEPRSLGLQLRTPTADTSTTNVIQATNQLSSAQKQLGSALSQAGARQQETGLSILGFGMNSIVEMKRDREQSFMIDAATKSSQEIMNLESELKNSISDPAGYTNAFISQVDEINREIAATAPSKDAARNFMLQASQQRIGLMRNAFQFEKNQTKEKVINDHQDNLNSMAIELRDNPSKLKTFAPLIQQNINNVKRYLDPSQGDAFEKSSKRMIADSQIKGLTAVNPDLALNELESGNFNTLFNADEIERYEVNIIKQAESRQRELSQISKEISNETLTEYTNMYVNNQRIEPDVVMNDPNLSPEHKRQALRMFSNRNRSDDNLTVFLEANDRLADGTLTRDWLLENADQLRPSTVRGLVEDITSDINGNPAYKRSSKRIDTLFKKNPFSITGALDNQADEKLKAEYMDRIRQGIQKGENADNLTAEILRSHAGRKSEQENNAIKNTFIKKMGGPDKISIDEIKKIQKELIKKKERKQISESMLRKQAKALEEIARELIHGR